MSGEKDTKVCINKSTLKLICSELSEHPTKAGVVRFTAPKTKLEPYPDYDKEESNAVYSLAASANTTLKTDKRFPSDDVAASAANVATPADTEKERESDEFSDYSEAEDGEYVSASEDASYTESDGGSDGNGLDHSRWRSLPRNAGGDSRSASATEGETAEEEEDDDYYDSEESVDDEPSDYEKRSWKREVVKPSIKRSAPVKPASEAPKRRSKRALPDRSSYELSRRAPARDRAKFERARRGDVRRSTRIKGYSRGRAETDSGKVARGNKSEPQSERVERPQHGSGFVFDPHPKPRASIPKRRADVSNAGGSSSKQPRRNGDTDRVSQIVPPKRKAGKIIRGYNKPDKPAAKPTRKSTRKSAKGARGDDDAAIAAAAAAEGKPSDPRTRKNDDSWAPGKPFPNCDSLEYFE